MLVFENAVSWVYYYPAQRVFELEWVAAARGSTYADTLLHALDLAREGEVRGWLSNHLHLRQIELPSPQWMNNVVLPRFLELGLYRAAVVESCDEHMRRQAGGLADSMEFPVAQEIRFFAERRMAWSWLTEPVEMSHVELLHTPAHHLEPADRYFI